MARGKRTQETGYLKIGETEGFKVKQKGSRVIVTDRGRPKGNDIVSGL